MNKTSEAARMLAQLSVAARRRKWGDVGFRKRMQTWGKLGGRPVGSGKQKENGNAN
jgi:hypothetical protein